MRICRRKFDDVLPLLVSLTFCLLVFGIILSVRQLGWLLSLELKYYDAILTAHWHQPPKSDAVLVIGITDDDMRGMNRLAPSDHELATLLTRLQKDGASAIGLDLIRDLGYLNPRVDPKAELNGPQELYDVLNRPPYNIVAITSLPGAGPEIDAPADLTFQSGQLALADIAEDSDGIVRRGIAHRFNEKLKDRMPKTAQGTPAPILSFAFRLAELGLKEKCHDDGHGRLCLGAAKYEPFGPDQGPYVGASEPNSGEGPVAGAKEPGFMFLLDYASGPIETVDWQAASDPAHLPPEKVKDKVILIGKRAWIDKDWFATPLNQNEFGVDLHASITDQLIRAGKAGGHLPRVWSWTGEASWILLWTVLGGMGAYVLRKPAYFALLQLSGLVALPLIGYVALHAGGHWLPIVPACLGWFTAAAFVTSYSAHLEGRWRRWFERFLTKTLGGKLATQLRELAGPDGELVSMELTATVLFTDIEGFSALSKRMEVKDLMPWLNRFMKDMSSLVEAHDGLVNKFIGDSIVAVFGVPIPSTNPEQQARDAVNAVKCALAMRGRLEVLNALYRESHHPTVGGMRIGIHTGRVVAGSLGSADRLEYTVIGESVNIASRLENLKSEHGVISPEQQKAVADPEISENHCRVIISKATHALVTEQFATKPIGTIDLKGVGPMDLFGVVGPRLASATEPTRVKLVRIPRPQLQSGSPGQ